MTYHPGKMLNSSLFFYCNCVFRIFLFDFLCELFVMFNLQTYDISFIIIEIFSLIPFMVMRFIVGMKIDLINSADVICTSFICFRIVYIKRFSRFFHSEVNRELYNIICSSVSLILISTILINVFENTQTIGKYWLFLERDCTDCFNCDGPNERFHTTLFFVTTILSTIGYYSSVTSEMGRCLIILLIIIQVVEIPTTCANFLRQISSKSIYARTSCKVLKGVDFILISGNVSSGSIDVLLQEYFHPDHGSNERHALVLLPQQPDTHMKKLFQIYPNKLFYFEGDISNENDLEKCQYKKASMMILLCNKQCDNPLAEDSKTVIQVMSIKKYFSRKKIQTLGDRIKNSDYNRLVIQLMRPESEHHYEVSVSSKAKVNNNDQILCIDEIKLALLSKSCLCKGLISLLSNIITTNSAESSDKNLLKLQEKHKWIGEYIKGKDYEIYRICLDSQREHSFKSIVSKIYKSNGIILFGLKIEAILSGNSIVLLSPTEYILPFDKTVVYYGYVLAKNQIDALAAQEYMERHHKMKNEFSQDLLDQNPNKKVILPSIDEDEDINDTKREDYLNEKIFIASTYHVTTSQISKESAICNTLQNKLLIKKGHIIICGMCQNLFDFIKPLRAKHIPK